MKKSLMILMAIVCTFMLTGCTETISKDESGTVKTDFSYGEVANVNDTKIKINSVKKVMNECLLEWDGNCQSYNNPENSFFLLVDLTIENNSSDDLTISSVMSFELKTTDGEKAEQTITLKAITSSLDGTIMPSDMLKGQIAYDVKESEQYYLYYKDSLLDSPIKFIINSSDIEQ